MPQQKRKSAAGKGTSPAGNASTARTRIVPETGDVLQGPDHKAAIEPHDAEEFFAALMCPVFEDIRQSIAKKALQHYLLPYPGYEDLDQPRKILEIFEKHLGADIEWKYFNGSDSSTAQMAQACDPTKSACENVTNTFDANLMLACQMGGALTEKDGHAVVKADMAETLKSPVATAEHYFGLCRDDFSDPAKFGKLRDFAKSHCVVRVFGGYKDKTNPCILDVIDAGCGVEATSEAWEGTLLSLNRGFKKYLTVTIGKWGWGAGGCFQNADLSLMASCVPGTDDVMFTIVEKAYMEDDRVPTFRYLTIKGLVPKIKKPMWWDDLMMPGEGNTPSTVIRHFRYQAPLTGKAGEKSISGVLDRLLPDPVLPVWTDYVQMVDRDTSFVGYRGAQRLVRGTLNKLRDSWKRKNQGLTTKTGGTDLAEVRHYDYFDINLGDHDFTGRTGVCSAGSVRAEIFVIEPGERTEKDAIKQLVDPTKCVLFHLDGQTHHEDFSTLVSASTRGANLAHVGSRCVLAVDCNNLSREAKFALFGSSREQMKGSELHKELKDLLIKRLANDKKLRQIDGELAMERRKNMKMPDRAEFADALSRYIQKTDLQFPKLTHKGKKRVRILEDRVVPGGSKKDPPAPIKEELPPRLLQWALEKKVVKMYPGQSYSWVLETSAPASWWQPAGPVNSHIKVLATGVKFAGADSFKAGRIRCHFECPDTAKPGDTGIVMAQMDYHPDYDMAPLVAALKVEVVEKSKPKAPGTRSPGGSKGNGKGKKIIKVPVWRDQVTEVEVDFLPPQPITFKDNEDTWRTLGWERDASKPSFTVMVESGEATLYYNPENANLIEARDATIKKHPGSEEKFLKEYEMKLALEGIFMLNENTFQAPEVVDSELHRIERMNRATGRNLAMDVARELDLEAKLDAERAGKV